MIIMIYDNEGEAIPDFACECQIGLLILKQRERPICVAYSTENIFHAMLTLISEGLVEPNKVIIIFHDNILIANVYGVIRTWPMGFCDHQGDWAERRLRAAMNKKKEERND